MAGWKRWTGVTRGKRAIGKATGIPWTKSGRQRKFGAAMSGGGCCMTVPFFLVIFGGFVFMCRWLIG